MDKKKSNITVNWKGKFGKRGLTETSLEILRKAGQIKKAEDLENDYSTLKMHKDKDTYNNIFSLEREKEMCLKYVNVLI